MPEISLLMIVRDEAARIGQVLADARPICDEVIVVDTGSTDATPLVAAEHGATVVHFRWRDDFAAARNEAIRHAHGKWAMYLDADDRVPPAARQAFLRLKAELGTATEFDVVQVPYRYSFAPPDSDVCTAAFPVGRVWRLGVGLRFTHRVHEHLDAPASRQVLRPDCYVEHRPRLEEFAAKSARNLRLLELEIASGDSSVRTAYFYAHELRRHQRLDEAYAAFSALAERPLSPLERYSVQLDLAQCVAVDDPERRREHLEAAVAADPLRADAYVHLGLSHYERGEWAEAIPYFESAEACEPPPSGTYNESYLAWFPSDCRAVCLAQLGRYEEAISATLAAFPGNPDPDRLRANLELYRARVAAAGGPET